MQIDADTCYRAVAGRDRRFDGKFLFGVVTTGIYCRPGCPSPIPRRTNVRFFPCAAAAEEAGLRPCQRCRPDTLPGTPAWLGTPATVIRALRLIADGALVEDDVDGLADRLGVGGRHLRRLFATHLGAPPLAIAQSQRVHFARKLIDETRLPMAEVAFSAGFGSVRRFNAAVRRTFGATPSELRARSRCADATSEALRLRLHSSQPFDWQSCLSLLAASAIPGVELTTADSYERTIQVGTSVGTLRVSCTGEHLVFELSMPARVDVFPLAERVRRMFDLDVDAAYLSAELGRDPVLGELVKPGLRVPGAWDPFELAVSAILTRHEPRSALESAARLVQARGVPLPAARPGLTHVFPTPAALAGSDLAELGIDPAASAGISAVAQALLDGSLSFDAWPSLSEGIERLLKLPGIDQETANYIAMRAACEPDAFCMINLALRGAALPPAFPGRAQDWERLAEAWRPWRAYAAVTLWLGGAGASRAHETLQ